MYYDTRDLNINSVALFRYAEVLLTLQSQKLNSEHLLMLSGLQQLEN